MVATVLEPLGQSVFSHVAASRTQSRRKEPQVRAPYLFNQASPLRVLEDLLQRLQPAVGELAGDDPPGVEGCLGVPEVLSQLQGAFRPVATGPPPIGVGDAPR